MTWQINMKKIDCVSKWPVIMLSKISRINIKITYAQNIWTVYRFCKQGKSKINI